MPEGRLFLFEIDSSFSNKGELMKKVVSVLIHLMLAIGFTFSTSPANAVNPGDIVTIAGGGVGDNGPAISANLYFPHGTAIDSAGNIFIADYGNNRIRKVTAGTGIITTVAGNGDYYGNLGDDGPATSAIIYNPTGVAVDSTGNLYIADLGNHRVRRLDAGTGVITSVAVAANLFSPTGVAVDISDNIYIADSGNNRILKVAAVSGTITTVAGNGTAAFSGDSGSPTSASLNNPTGTVVDSAGNIYIADRGNNRIRMVSATTGFITTVAGTGTAAFSGDNGPATSAALSSPYGIAIDRDGNILIADQYNFRIRKLTVDTGTISTVAGNGTFTVVDNVSATSTFLYAPTGVATDSAGNFYIAAYQGNSIRKVDAVTGFITTIAGNGSDNFSGENVAGTSAKLKDPGGSAVDSAGNIYFADSGNHRIRKIAAGTGIITTVAGNGSAGFSGNNGPATSAALQYPSDVAVDIAGNLYIADSNNNRIRKVASGTGIITTVAGTGIGGFGGDNGPATSAWINFPRGIAIDVAGNIYIADSSNNRIRKVSTSTGFITTIAGDGTAGFSGDEGLATAAKLNQPNGIAVDSSGNLYISDNGNYRIRKVIAGTGIINTVAGNGTAVYSGDSGSATSAGLGYLSGIAADNSGNIYIAASGRVRRVAAGSGTIETVAGTGYSGFTGDNGPATLAAVTPVRVTTDSSGNLYISDGGNSHRIRKVFAPGFPAAITNPASAITQTSATLNGTINDNGGTTTVSFEYGQTASYGTSITAGSIMAGAGTSAVTAAITGLTCSTAYHYRVVGANSAGNTYGSDATFTTGTCPPVNGVCGSSNGKTLPLIPSANLCSAGTASTVIGTGPWSWTCDGLYTGSPASCGANYAPDITPPTITLSMLADGAVTRESLVNVTGVAKDNINGSGIAWVKVNGNPVEFNSVNGVFSYPLPLAGASTIINVTTQDLSGNNASASRTVNRDISTPLLTIDSPNDYTTTSVALMNISGMVETGATVNVSLNGAAPVAAQVTGNGYTAQVTLSSATTLNTIQVTATGLSGKSSSVKRSIRYNVSRWTMEITDPPQDMLTTAGSYLLKGRVADVVNAPLTITITRGADTYTPVVSNGTFEQLVTLPASGLHAFSVLGTDSQGLKTSVTRVINKGIFELPFISAFSMPPASSSFTVPLTFTASDNVGITGWCASFVATTPDTCSWVTSAPASYTFKTQGAKKLYGYVKDTAGNISAAIATTTITVADQPMTVTLSGTGKGTVTSNPAGISCISGSTTGCSASFTAGPSVSLSQLPQSDSTFDGWSGDCSGTGTCSNAMTAARNVTATFTLAPKAMIGTTGFTSLGLATATVSAGTEATTILVIGLDLDPEMLTVDSNRKIILIGGHNSDYSKGTTPTTLKGPLTISTGSLTVEALVVK